MPQQTPQIVGIVNITEDSFSDGGTYIEPEAAIDHARTLVEQGASIVDLGPASSHPDAQKVTAEEEIARLEPVLNALEKDGVRISIDSFQPKTQLYCAKRSVALLNDIQGFPHEASRRQLAAYNCSLVVMHSIQQFGIATREQTKAENVIQGMYNFFERRIAELLSAGIEEQRIILDPGMGFFLGSTPEPSVQMLKELAKLKRTFGLPLLVSVSRKSFLKTICGLPTDELDSATLAAELYLAEQGVDYIRTHNVQGLSSALLVQQSVN